MLFASQPPVEARRWLRSHLDTPAFAIYRFRETNNALEFVEALYAEGATEVLVDDPHLTGDGRLLADTLLVRFPPDGVTRFRLVRFCEREGPDPKVPEDFVLTEFAAELRLWW